MKGYHELQKIEQRITKYPNLVWVLYFSLISFLYFGVIGSLRFLLYKTYHDAGYTYLNALSYITNYLIGPCILLIVDYIINRFKYGFVIYIGSFYSSLFVVGGLLVMSCQLGYQDGQVCNEFLINVLIVFTTTISGFCSAIFFVTQASYITFLSSDINRQLYFGIAFSIFECSTLIGNLMGYILVDQLGTYYYYVFNLCLALSFQLLFFFCHDIRQLQSEQQNIIALSKNEFKSIIMAFKMRKMVLFTPFVLFNAIIQTSQFQFIPPLVLSVIGETDDGLYLLSQVFSSLGHLIGGIGLGLIARSIGPHINGYISLSLVLIGILSSIYSVYEKTYITLMISLTLYGVGYSGMIHSLFSILTLEIGNSNTNLAANNFTICAGCLIASIAWLYLNSIDIIYSIIFMSIVVVFDIISLVFYGKKRVTVTDISTLSDE